MKKTITRFTSVLLTLLLILSLAPVSVLAAGSVTVKDPDQKAAFFNQTNAALNALKTSMPYLKMTSDVRLTKATTGSREYGEEMSEDAKKYLAWLVDACLVKGSGLAETLSNTINGIPRVPEEVTFVYGERRDNRLPLVGKTYVSALTVNDDFVLKTRSEGGTMLHPEKEITYMRIELPDTALEDAKGSSFAKAFDIPKTAFDPVIVSGEESGESGGALSTVTFDGFTFDNAYIEAQFNHDGELIAYTSSVDYVFELSLYDAVRIISAYTGINWVAIVEGIAETVYGFTEESGSGKDILKQSVLYVTYNASVAVTDINWTKRYFGDTDNDGDVTSADARTILRYSVGKQDELYINQMNEIYSDLDFDGEITPADARLALRLSVGLDEKFTDVPDGKDIKIVFIGDVEVPEDPVDPVGPEDPFDPVLPEDPVIEDKGSVADVVQALTDSITGLVEFFQQQGDEKNERQTERVLDIFSELLGRLG